MNVWDAITHLKDLFADSQVQAELKLLLQVIIRIISKLMTKEEFTKRLKDSSGILAEYVYENTEKSPAVNVSDADSIKVENGPHDAPLKWDFTKKTVL